MFDPQHSEICLCVIGNLNSGGDSIRKLDSQTCVAPVCSPWPLRLFSWPLCEAGWGFGGFLESGVERPGNKRLRKGNSNNSDHGQIRRWSAFVVGPTITIAEMFQFFLGRVHRQEFLYPFLSFFIP
jgi:hypothetical protein